MEALPEILASLNRTQQLMYASVEASRITLVIVAAMAAAGFAYCGKMLVRQGWLLVDLGRLQAESHKLQAESYKLQSESYKLQTESYKLQAESQRLQIEIHRQVAQTESYAARIAASLENVSRLVVHAGGRLDPQT